VQKENGARAAALNLFFSQNGYWILSFNDFKSSMVKARFPRWLLSFCVTRTLKVHLFGIMLVNNWNSFFSSYQIIFGYASNCFWRLKRHNRTFNFVRSVARSRMCCRRWAVLYFYAFYFFIVIITFSLLVILPTRRALQPASQSSP
jgi:hypothetical protein